MVVAGCGVDHDELVRHVEKHFNSETCTWNAETLGNSSVTEVDTSVAQYTGGTVKVSGVEEEVVFRRMRIKSSNRCCFSW